MKLKRGHTVTRMLKKAGARAGFDSFENVVYLRKNATFYDAFHELKHVEHRALLGQAEYRRIGEFARESHVFNEIWRNRERFNRDELLHVIEYIRDERPLFRRGGID